MSEIKKVIYENLKKSYWAYENNIFEESFFLKKYPSFFHEVNNINAAIKNGDEKVKASYTVKGQYRAFPSANKMIETLENKRLQIYDMLEINKIDNNFPMAKALVIMYYLANRSLYDMTTMEITLNKLNELNDNFKRNNEYKEQIMKKQIEDLTKKNKEDKLTYSEKQELVDLFYKIENYYKYKDSKSCEIDNITTLYYLYDTLIYKIGVCAIFSYAYKYLLSKLNIQPFTLSYLDNKSNIGHAFNIVQNFVNLQPVYYGIDITYSINFKNYMPEIMLHTASVDINKNFIGDIKILSLSRIMDLKKDAQYTFLNDIYTEETWAKLKERIVINPNLKTEIKIAKEHIQNLSQAIKIDNDEIEL